MFFGNAGAQSCFPIFPTAGSMCSFFVKVLIAIMPYGSTWASFLAHDLPLGSLRLSLCSLPGLSLVGCACTEINPLVIRGRSTGDVGVKTGLVF